jgi:hypothetical protein
LFHKDTFVGIVMILMQNYSGYFAVTINRSR